MSKVSVSMAASMAGVSRATFYRHIEEKQISIERDDKKNIVIDIAELIRVYGDKLQTREQAENGKKESYKANRDNPVSLPEVQALKNRLDIEITERERERNQLVGQIEDLRARLERSEEQRIRSEEQKDKLTLMLTDQRNIREKFDEKEHAQSQKLEEMQKMIYELREKQQEILTERHGKRGIFTKLFGT